MDAMVEISNVTKVYRKGEQGVVVLDGVSMTIGAGRFAALMGPSGSGKTTLLNLLAGIDSPTSGSIKVAGKDISGLSESELCLYRSRSVGLIFQLYNLIPVLTAEENVELPLLLTSLGSAERRKRVDLALELVGLSHRKNHHPTEMSGGEQQRVSIARSVVKDPQVLLADEPTGDLDAKSASEILDLLKGLNKQLNKTIIMVTHDPKAAEAAHEIHRLEKGKLLNG